MFYYFVLGCAVLIGSANCPAVGVGVGVADATIEGEGEFLRFTDVLRDLGGKVLKKFPKIGKNPLDFMSVAFGLGSLTSGTDSRKPSRKLLWMGKSIAVEV